MKQNFSTRIQKFISCTTASSPIITPRSSSITVDVTEEYANAFRTESYLDFWTRVVAVSTDSTRSKIIPMESTTAARLPSYRLFMEHLLDPDQTVVTRILTMTRNHPKNHALLSDYFTQTADASNLCGLLLKDIDRTRVKYRSIITTLQSLNKKCPTPTTLTQLTRLSTSLSPKRVQGIQAGCSDLLKRLESTRNKTRANLRLASKFETGSAVFLVAVTATLSVIVVMHALAIVVATPAIVAISLDLAFSKKLARMAAQLDAATKGVYILNRDLETVGRLVARLNDELEHMRRMIQYWVERGKEDWLQAGGAVACQLKKTDCSFRQQLDDLEEHLYLCFMTINRARTLVVKEIGDPGKSKTNITSL